MDPLHKESYTGSYDSETGKRVGVEDLIRRIKYRQNLEITASAISYLCYHSAKEDLGDADIWKEIEFFVAKDFRHMEPRMFYGCFYGAIKSNLSSLTFLLSMKKIFEEKCLPTLKVYDCYELIEAVSCCDRTDFSAVQYMHETLMPFLEKNWKRADFLHIDRYLLEFMVNLTCIEYYEKSVWAKIIENINRKNFRDVEKWRRYYDFLNLLKKEDFEKYSNVSLDQTLQKFEDMWHGNEDLQWKYSLEHKRYHTVEEMIAKGNTPEKLTWQEGEKYIKHTLPKWYFRDHTEDSPEVAVMLREYNKLQRKRGTR